MKKTTRIRREKMMQNVWVKVEHICVRQNPPVLRARVGDILAKIEILEFTVLVWVSHQAKVIFYCVLTL